MPQPRPSNAGSRGPVARHPSLAPTGFRVADRTRFELQAAGLFTGRATLQAVLDLAVAEFLERLRGVEGFVEALEQAEREQRRRAGTPTLHRPH